MNSINKFFENFNKLFYWLLILTSFLLTQDIVRLLFFNKIIDEDFTELKINEILLIFIFQIFFIFTAVVIYNFLESITTYLPKIKNYSDDFKIDRDNYYSYQELLNDSVKTNNQTMYNYYKEYKEELKLTRNQKYLCFTVILLFILSLFIQNSSLRIIFENFNSFSYLKRIFVLLIIPFDLLGLLVVFSNNPYSDFTEIYKDNKLPHSKA